jgi:hypothetical protein
MIKVLVGKTLEFQVDDIIQDWLIAHQYELPFEYVGDITAWYRSEEGTIVLRAFQSMEIAGIGVEHEHDI